MELPEITLRDSTEIQRAHDILVAVILHETPYDPNDGVRMLIEAQASTLCWVLNHEHNQTFAMNLADIEERIADLGGGRIVDSGRLQRRNGT